MELRRQIACPIKDHTGVSWAFGEPERALTG